MTDYVRTRTEIKMSFLAGTRGGSDLQNSREFDRWIRNVQSEAWDEGNQAGEYDAYYEVATVDKYRNPYRD